MDEHHVASPRRAVSTLAGALRDHLHIDICLGLEDGSR